MISHQLYTFLTLGGGILGIVLASGEIVRRDRTHVHYILFAFLFSTGMWQLYASALFGGLLDGRAAHLRMLHLPFAYAVGPCVWFYLRPLLADKGKGRMDPPLLTWRDLWHFVIIPCALAFLTPALIAGADYKIALTDFSQNVASGRLEINGGRSATAYEELAALLLYAPKISVLAYCTMWLSGAWLRRRSITGRKDDGNVHLSLATFVSLYALTAGIVTSAALALVDHFVANLDWHRAGASGASLCIYALYIIDRRFAIYHVPVESPGRSGASPRPAAFRGSSRLNGLPVQELKARVECLLEVESLYADEDLSLGRLAAALSQEGTTIHSHQLSALINREFGCNFNQLVNRYRVQAARQLLESEPERSILSIAMASGFNSKSVFHRAFKQEFDITPGEYRRRL